MCVWVLLGMSRSTRSLVLILLFLSSLIEGEHRNER